jgi:hypothetical protein
MSNAPICHIPPETTTTQPGPQSLPAIPVAQPNVQSLTAAVNAMRQLLIIYLGQQRGPNSTISSPRNNSGSWQETNRVTEKVKIYQNNDPTTGNFVEVEQINSLTMTQKSSGQKWTWQRG